MTESEKALDAFVIDAILDAALTGEEYWGPAEIDAIERWIGVGPYDPRTRVLRPARSDTSE